MIQVMDL